jgi:hypothetical protein
MALATLISQGSVHLEAIPRPLRKHLPSRAEVKEHQAKKAKRKAQRAARRKGRK